MFSSRSRVQARIHQVSIFNENAKFCSEVEAKDFFAKSYSNLTHHQASMWNLLTECLTFFPLGKGRRSLKPSKKLLEADVESELFVPDADADDSSESEPRKRKRKVRGEPHYPSPNPRGESDWRGSDRFMLSDAHIEPKKWTLMTRSHTFGVIVVAFSVQSYLSFGLN